MSPLMIFLAVWLGSAVLVLIGGFWLVSRHPVEGERLNADELAVQPTEHVGSLPSQSRINAHSIGQSARNGRSAEPQVRSRERVLKMSQP